MKTNKRPVGLRFLAERLGLSQGTVSMALSGAAQANKVAKATRERVIQSAIEHNYRPNLFARQLSTGRSYTIGVMVPSISEGYYSTVIAGIEEQLRHHNFFFLVTSHHWDPDLIRKLPEVLASRGAEGLVIVNTACERRLCLPAVHITGELVHNQSTTHVRLDEKRGTRLALDHLSELGHKHIAFMRGDNFSPATGQRWAGIRAAAKALDIKINPKLVVELRVNLKRVEGDRPGYTSAQRLLARGVPFTALVAYNDKSAIEAIRAFQDAGLRVPEDISVVGYDDIPAAEHERPALTTVRQPLRSMGITAAELIVRHVEKQEIKKEVLVKPTFVLRKSTAPASEPRPRGRRMTSPA